MNADCMSVTLLTSQLFIEEEPPLLKLVAPLNIASMVATLDVSQEPIFWLNAVALQNIDPILVTLEVFQEPISWLNALAS